MHIFIIILVIALIYVISVNKEYFYNFIKKYFWIIFAILFGLLLFRLGGNIIAATISTIPLILVFINKIINLQTLFRSILFFFGGKKEPVKSAIYEKAMTIEEARAILGVDEKSSQEDIQQAYLKAMQKNHPDNGGSSYLASKINQARDMLLK